jgi:putative membrane protein insertion efficiency factor
MSVPRTNQPAQESAADHGARRGKLPLAMRLALGTIRWYQGALSPLMWSACRYYPSCSQYTYEAIEKYGLASGAWMGCKRLLRCHPFARRWGYDPVRERDESFPVEAAPGTHEVHQ